MKKVCCSLLLLLFTFVCLFATIPKNKVNATSIITEDVTLPYFLPDIMNFRFGDVALSVTPEKMYGLSSTENVIESINTTMYESQVLNYRIENSLSYGLVYGSEALSSIYWSRYDNSLDSKYYYRHEFSSLPQDSYGDLVITLLFTNHSFNYQFLTDYQNVSLLDLELPFTPDNYTYNLDFAVSYPYGRFDYVTGSGLNAVGSRYDTDELGGTYTERFGYGEPLSIDPLKLLDLSNVDIYSGTSDIPLLLSGSIRITIPNWADKVVSGLSFDFQFLTHPFSSYQEYPERAVGIYPSPEYYNFFYMPRGLPVDCAECEDCEGGGACEDSGFIENISTSLLKGVQNFLSFEISPGFSLYHILLLIVAIPLLIFILKLFLGG